MKAKENRPAVLEALDLARAARGKAVECGDKRAEVLLRAAVDSLRRFSRKVKA